MPDPHAIAVLILTVVVFWLYTRPWIRIELVSLILLLALLLLFYIFPYNGPGTRLTDTEIFRSFGHPALVAICSLMIIGQGITMTGAMEPAARLLSRLWRLNRPLGSLVTLLVAGGASAFINDTPMLVLMLPLVLDLTARTGYPRSKALMPVNCAILIGGMLTVVGTSTNILVLSIAVDLGMKPIAIFDFTSISIVAFALAIPYLWLIAPALLPSNAPAATIARRTYEARLVVSDDSSRIVDRTLGELARKLGRALPVSMLVRDGSEYTPDDSTELAPGDTLFLRDTPEGLREIASTFHVDLFDRVGPGRFVVADPARVDLHLAEIVIGTASELAGRTLREARFAEKHEVVVIGLNRDTEGLLRGTYAIGEARLASGDVLLVQGSPERIAALRSVPHLLLLDSIVSMPRSPLAKWALLIMGGVMFVAATRILPIHVAAFMGVILMLATGCVRLDGMGRALSLEVVLILASSVALGESLISTGAAAWIAQGATAVVQHMPPAAQLASFMAFAALLTNFVSNSATAAVGTPIAIATAHHLGAPLEPFALAILFGANLCYATPMAYQTNLLIMGAGGYRFMDYVRVGLPLVLLMLATLSVLLARHYGL
jgi:di/tricarboxylate transporter